MTHQPDHDTDAGDFVARISTETTFFRDLVEHALDGFVTLDSSGTIAWH